MEHAAVRLRVLPLLLAAGSVAALSPRVTAGAAADRLIGSVQALDAQQRTLTILGNGGNEQRAVFDLETACLRAQPGAVDLKTAVAIECSQLAVGDRVLLRGRLSGSVFQTRQIVVMTRADLEQRQAQDRAEWRRRGTAGVVKALDSTNGSITVEVRSFFRSREFLVSTAERKATFRRYPPDVTLFGDTEPSSFSAVGVGDQIQALGDWTEDRARFLAEQVVSGSFRTVLGSVERLGPEAQQLVLKTLPERSKGAGRKGGETIVIQVVPEASVRRLPAEMAARLVGRRAGDNAGSRSSAAGGDRSGRLRGTRGGEGSSARNVGDMWDRLPTIKVGELQTGEYVAVAVAESRTPGKARATAVLGGIEPLIRESQPTGDEAPAFSIEGLDLGMGQP
jgi:hypothetical protein